MIGYQSCNRIVKYKILFYIHGITDIQILMICNYKTISVAYASIQNRNIQCFNSHIVSSGQITWIYTHVI